MELSKKKAQYYDDSEKPQEHEKEFPIIAWSTEIIFFYNIKSGR